MAKKKIKKKAKKIIVIGGALAGPTAAARARELDETAEITIIERNNHISYGLTGLGYHLSGEISNFADLDREDGRYFAQTHNIQVLTRTSVEKIAAKSKTIKIRREGVTEELKYDSLIFALGAGSIKPKQLLESEIETLTNFSYFRTLGDLEKIKKAAERE